MIDGTAEGERVYDGEPPITAAQVAAAEADSLPAKNPIPAQLAEHAWKPGQSGHPKGREKGIAKRVRDLIGNDPSQVLSVLLDIALSEREKSTDRIMAARELLDRGYGKAPTHAPVEGGDPLGKSELDEAITAITDELLERRKAKGP